MKKKALEIGNALAAQYLLTGTISNALGKNIVNAQIVETESGKIISSASTSIGIKDFESFSKELFSERGKISSSLFRSLLVPGWGQFYTNNTARGIISFVACLGAGCFTVGSGIKTSLAHLDSKQYSNYMYSNEMIVERNRVVLETGKSVDEVNAIFEQKEDDLYTFYSKKYDKTIILAAITGGLWILNLVDATIAGINSKKKIDFYFTGDSNCQSFGIAFTF